MIDSDTLKIEWIEKISGENRGADKILVEKVIRALLLLEGLSHAKLPFLFKGGTAVMLILGVPRRFSIDIDIVVPEDNTLEKGFGKIVKEKGFSRFELQNRESYSEIEKIHYKFFYSPAYRTNINEDNILLDILIESENYKKIKKVDITSPFVKHSGAPLKVRVPGKEDILADKMTAFAPYTTGIPYEKSGRSMAMEIIKQLYDIGSLFEDVKGHEYSPLFRP